MKTRLIICCLIALMATTGCLPDKAEQERTKWLVKPDKENKLPYGTWLAYQSMKYFFPGATIESLPRSFRYTSIDSKMKYNNNGQALLVLDGLDFYTSRQEWDDLKSFMNSGNEVIIFCSQLDHKIEKELGCHKEQTSEEQYPAYYVSGHGTGHSNILTITYSPLAQYRFNGRSVQSYFSFPNDTGGGDSSMSAPYFDTHPDTLGYVENKPDLIRYKIGDGHLTIHAAPLVLSNYFLLQQHNESYLAAIWHTLPPNINRVYWNDYYIRKSSSAGLGLLFRYPSTRLALLLAIFAILLYILFEGKRKQRVIPIIEPLKNDSVSFAETVGRLYYNKGDHSNLSSKMIQQFLDWVRTHYLLNTNLLNENFIAQLTIKSGQPEATVRSLMEMIHEIKLNTAYIDDAYLYQLYHTIQLFYKNNRH